MNPFRAVAKVVTAPAHVVKDGVRLVRIEQAGQTVLDLLDDAAAHPELYRTPTWWERLLIAAQQVVNLIPLPEQGRTTMNSFLAKLGMITGSVVAVAGALQSAPIPPKYQGYVALIGSFAAMLSGLYHPAPGAQPAQGAGV